MSESNIPSTTQTVAAKMASPALTICEKTPGFSSVQMNSQPHSAMSTEMDSASKCPSDVLDHRTGCLKRKADKLWTVKTTKQLPPTYALERNAVLIHETAQTIASRIAEYAKAHSVQATFESNGAKATCTTNCFLKFVITLFSDGDEGGIIVEVQKRKGCSLEFARQRRIVINAAKGVKDVSLAQKRPRLSIPPSLLAKCAPPDKQTLMDMLDRIVGEFHTQGRDGQLISLRHVANMTDPEKSGSQTSLQVAEMVLGSDIGLREIIGFILAATCPDEMSLMMRHSSLTILSNCFTLLSQRGTDIADEVMREDEQDWLVRSLFPSLVDDIRRCKWLHNAFLSSKCLYLLMENFPVVRSKAKAEDGLVEVLYNAVAIGEESHVNLERQARRAIDTLVCH